MIKLEALRTFVTVAKAGNIAIASEQLGRTPSAISMTLKSLEIAIGGSLFETERKNALSTLGLYTFQVATDQVTSFDNAISKIADFAASKVGTIAISCVPSAAIHILPEVLPRFTKNRPDVSVELYDTDAHSVFAAVQSGAADIGIAGRPPAQYALDFEPLFQDRFVVIYNPNHHNIASCGPLHWSQIKDYPLIINGASDMINSSEFKQLTQSSTLTVRNISSLFAMLRAGIGITILPALTVLDLPENLASLPLADTSIKRVVGLVKPTARSYGPLMAHFRQCVLDSLPAIAGRLDAIELVHIPKA